MRNENSEQRNNGDSQRKFDDIGSFTVSQGHFKDTSRTPQGQLKDTSRAMPLVLWYQHLKIKLYTNPFVRCLKLKANIS